jgi:hypothetical protein
MRRYEKPSPHLAKETMNIGDEISLAEEITHRIAGQTLPPQLLNYPSKMIVYA